MSGIASSHSNWQKTFFGLIFFVSTGLALLALLIPALQSATLPVPEAGQVALRSYTAPQTISYTSEIMTEQRREAAEQATLPVYTAPDTHVARQQLERLRASQAYINSVRADQYSSAQQKMDDLAALEELHLSQQIANSILEFPDARWQAIQQEAIVVLEKVMGSTIRPEEISEALSRVPVLVSLSLTEAQATVAAEMAAAFVAPNSQYSASLTEAAREEARRAVQPATRTFVTGQTIVSQGQVLSAEDVEALQQLGLVESAERWPGFTSAAALVLVLAVFLLFYFRRVRITITEPTRSIALIALLFLFFLFAARLTIPARTVIPYAFPLAAYSLTVAAIFGTELALFSSLPLAVLVAYGLPNALDLTLYYIIGSLFGVLALGRARRMTTFFWAGVTIAVSGSIIVLVYRLPQPATDAIGLATLTGAAFFNGLASASITLLLQFALAQFLGLTTPMQLVDLTRPDHPLLQMLLREAPGTYQHSLQVANLAEQAGERVGADTLLIRVGALYHDVGKAQNPAFFIENQAPGFVNPHESLSPVESAGIIIRHVSDGLELAKKYRLPRRILDFIVEHHGTMITRYQYINAVKAAGGDESQVDIEQFRYPGLRPQSCETAILLLADGAEARVRAERPLQYDELLGLIREVIDNRVSKGLLDDTQLTLQDLNIIAESFTATLRGIYHPRLKYPKLEIPESASSEFPTVPIKSKASADVKLDAP